MSDTCNFRLGWRGRCDEEKPCLSHDSLVCSSCGAPATRECEATGQLVCGFPLCDDCEHVIYPDGTNGGVGFDEQGPPDGLRRHVRKSCQKFKPWYMKGREA